jgi:hypothetical protein
MDFQKLKVGDFAYFERLIATSGEHDVYFEV